MDLYAENILDHSKYPRRKITLKEPSVSHAEKNLSCGDKIEIQLKIENGRITDIGWSGDGCAISQAGMSILSDELMGKGVEKASSLEPRDILDLLGVPVGTRRLKCALLSLHALKNALHTYKEEPLQSWTETVGNDSKTS